jgi:hypothetical protein
VLTSIGETHLQLDSQAILSTANTQIQHHHYQQHALAYRQRVKNYDILMLKRQKQLLDIGLLCEQLLEALVGLLKSTRGRFDGETSRGPDQKRGTTKVPLGYYSHTMQHFLFKAIALCIQAVAFHERQQLRFADWQHGLASLVDKALVAEKVHDKLADVIYKALCSGSVHAAPPAGASKALLIGAKSFRSLLFSIQNDIESWKVECPMVVAIIGLLVNVMSDAEKMKCSNQLIADCESRICNPTSALSISLLNLFILDCPNNPADRLVS